MATGRMRQTLAHLRQVVQRNGRGGTPDAELLERFRTGGEQDAFAELVRRHGPMVLGVCRRVLGDAHDADDAFQATFLVLARKAGSVTPAGNVAGWLHGVACRTARRLRDANARRRAREREAGAALQRAQVPPAAWDDLRPLIDGELERLPERYRAAVVLCDLEGCSRREAAGRLGWKEGTLSSRLARGRRMLARRLARRGLHLPEAALAALLAQNASAAAVPPAAPVLTARVAAAIISGDTTATGAGSATAAALAKGACESMSGSKTSVATALLLLAGVCGSGVGVAYTLAGGEGPAANSPSPPQGGPVTAEAIQGDWVLTRAERDGRALDFAPGSVTLVVTNDHWVWKERGQDRLFRYRLGAAQVPTPLDLVSQAEGIDRGKVLSCICALHGQALRVCQSEGPRPASFATAPGSGKVLFEFRRAGGAAGWKTSAQNEIDRLVGMKLRDLRTKSAYADWVRTWREVTDPDYDEWVRRALLAIKVQHEVDDATFLRRVYLDLLGAPPTAEELRRFLKETDRDKRAKLVERLLQRLARAKRLEQIVKETIAKGRELTAEEHRLIEAILKWLEEDDSDEPVLQRLDELRLKD